MKPKWIFGAAVNGLEFAAGRPELLAEDGDFARIDGSQRTKCWLPGKTNCIASNRRATEVLDAEPVIQVRRFTETPFSMNWISLVLTFLLRALTAGPAGERKPRIRGQRVWDQGPRRNAPRGWFVRGASNSLCLAVASHSAEYRPTDNGRFLIAPRQLVKSAVHCSARK